MIMKTRNPLLNSNFVVTFKTDSPENNELLKEAIFGFTLHSKVLNEDTIDVNNYFSLTFIEDEDLNVYTVLNNWMTNLKRFDCIVKIGNKEFTYKSCIPTVSPSEFISGELNSVGEVVMYGVVFKFDEVIE